MQMMMMLALLFNLVVFGSSFEASATPSFNGTYICALGPADNQIPSAMDPKEVASSLAILYIESNDKGVSGRLANSSIELDIVLGCVNLKGQKLTDKQMQDYNKIQGVTVNSSCSDKQISEEFVTADGKSVGGLSVEKVSSRKINVNYRFPNPFGSVVNQEVVSFPFRCQIKEI